VCYPEFIRKRLLEARHRILAYKNRIERPCLKQCLPSAHKRFHLTMRIFEDISELIDGHDDLMPSPCKATRHVPDALKGVCIYIRPSRPVLRNFETTVFHAERQFLEEQSSEAAP